MARSDITSLLEAATFDSLLEAWRRMPAAEIADALEQDPADELAEVVTGDCVTGLARLTRLPDAIDPRFASTLVQWLAAPPWHAGRAKPFFQQVCKRLVAIADPRCLSTLPAARKAVQKVVKGASMRGWFVERIDKTLAAIRATRAELPALSAADAKLATRAGKALAKQPARPKQPSKRTDAAAALLAAIRANPADDGARQVYADVLTEKGDPRGMFITMQLARGRTPPTPAQRKQETELLFKHARIWLGELAAVVGNLSRHFLALGRDRNGGLRFERGFLSGCRVRGSRNKIVAIAAHPGLATVEELELREHGELVLQASELPALEEISLSASQLPILLARPAAAHVRIVTLLDDDRGPGLIDDVASCARLPALRALRVFPSSREIDDIATRAIRTALGIRQLDTVHVDAFRGGGDYVRSGKAWAFTKLPRTRPAIADVYRALAR